MKFGSRSRTTGRFNSAARTLIVAAAFLLGCGLPFSAAHSAEYDLAFVQLPVGGIQEVGGDVENSILSERYFKGMEIVIADSKDISSRQVVTNGFFCATDPTFSLDGEHLMFSGKRSGGDRLQLWEISLADPKPKQVLSCDGDCISPLYLPNGHVVFAATCAHEYEEHGGGYSFSIYEWSPDYEMPVRLTFNPSSEFEPALIDDGRLIFSSWQHVGNHYWPGGNVALVTTNWDGTGLFPFTGNHRNPRFKRGASVLDDSRIAFIQTDDLEWFGAGALVAADMNDPFADYQPLSAADEYLVGDIAAMPNGGMIVSARPSDGTDASFGLYTHDGAQLTPLYDGPDHHELSPAFYDPNRDPDTRFSTVVPDKSFGYLLILNCFETDRIDQSLLTSETVKRVRIIEGLPAKDDGGATPDYISVPGQDTEPLICAHSATNYIPGRILGEVPPASDGSIYLKVPADRPLRVQLVDQDGLMLMNERAWFWVRPHERRVCVGCHENRELSPYNKTARAAKRMPTDLTDPAGWETVTYHDDIRPIVTSSCGVMMCHTPPHPTAMMNLTTDRWEGDMDPLLADRFDPAYANLLRRQAGKPFSVGGRLVHPGDSRGSPLMWMLYGKALGPQYGPAPFTTPINSSHPGPMLPEESLRLFRTWIDLGAIYDDQIPAGGWSDRDTKDTEEQGDGH